jgi:hypothetical protein
MRQNPEDIPFLACDNSCIVAHPTGMATNGGCRCEERQLRRAVMWWRTKAQYLQYSIEMLRGTGIVCPHMFDADDKLCMLPVGHLGVHGTIDDIGVSHDKWRSRADALEAALIDVSNWNMPEARAQELKALIARITA